MNSKRIWSFKWLFIYGIIHAQSITLIRILVLLLVIGLDLFGGFDFNSIDIFKYEFMAFYSVWCIRGDER